ncbi:hypothetical protein C8J25_107281 [Sphingomonas faeni]|uniref:Uncharacterized protein n=1 Tax=Sphingomonas faeni TaxID=185950 RepID=A0A2T5U255_9SPHN|nr:hypothetical protein [Sphingomonas faeni]PTW45596.1 hypothetical protein C8J25_107281 [Sphingomonas faeni]
MEEDKNNVVTLRDDKTKKFVKGGVGNPGGAIGPVRELALIEKMSVEQMYRSRAVEVFEELIRLIKDKKVAPTAKIAAIKEFNSRALGNPSSTTIIKSGEDGNDRIDLSELDDSVLRTVAELASRDPRGRR